MSPSKDGNSKVTYITKPKDTTGFKEITHYLIHSEIICEKYNYSLEKIN